MMFDALFINAWIVSVALAMISGPLGCFVVWRRMAYFGDTMAHASLLGISLGVVMGIAPGWSVMLVVLGLASALMFLEARLDFHSDTVLGYLSHTALALGLVVVGSMTVVRVDLMGLLLGDVLLVSDAEALFAVFGSVLIGGVLAWLWRPLLAVTINADLARVEGVSIVRVKWIFTLLLALFIASAIKVVGVLLITALLIIPAAAARNFAKTPESMAMLSTAFAVAAAIAGLVFSFVIDVPAGPAIVLNASALFLMGAVAKGVNPA